MRLFDFFKHQREKEAERERYHFPVDFSRYTKEIFVTGVTLEPLLAMIGEELSVTDDPMTLASFQVEEVTDSDWYHIQCADEIDFYGFHNLVNWLYDYKEDQAIIMAIGLAQHKTKAELSYYIVQEGKGKEDTVIGVMNNDKSFYVYLPESSVENGNIMVRENRLKGVKMDQFLLEYGLKK